MLKKQTKAVSDEHGQDMGHWHKRNRILRIITISTLHINVHSALPLTFHRSDHWSFMLYDTGCTTMKDV